MTEHPITPPPSLALIKKWIIDNGLTVSIAEASAIASLASRLGADQELEACCKWLKTKEWIHPEFSDELRAARRPKPPSLKEQALAKLAAMERLWEASGNEPSDLVRRALKQLDD